MGKSDSKNLKTVSVLSQNGYKTGRCGRNEQEAPLAPSRRGPRGEREGRLNRRGVQGSAGGRPLLEK